MAGLSLRRLSPVWLSSVSSSRSSNRTGAFRASGFLLGEQVHGVAHGKLLGSAVGKAGEAKLVTVGRLQNVSWSPDPLQVVLGTKPLA